jgi:signal peptidase II
MVPTLLILIFIDQITKAYFASRDFFVANYGLLFTLDFGTVLNASIVVLVLVFFLWLYRGYKDVNNKVSEFAFALIFAGAISNLIDRLIFGFVRDFADFGLGFTFNLADLFIVIGLVLLLFSKPDK